MSQKQESGKAKSSGTNKYGNTWTTYNDGAYRYNNKGGGHKNHYYNTGKGYEFMTANGGKESGYQWTRKEGGEPNVKYDNRKK